MIFNRVDTNIDHILMTLACIFFRGFKNTGRLEKKLYFHLIIIPGSLLKTQYKGQPLGVCRVKGMYSTLERKQN